MKKASGKSNLSIVKDYLEGNRPFIQVGYDSNVSLQERKEGEIWTDSAGKKWIKKNGFRKAINNVKADVVDSIKQVCPDCKLEIKWGNRYDQIFFNKTGKCQDCVAKFESKLKLEGKFESYERKKVCSNKLSISKDLRDKIEDSLKFLESHDKISFPNGDGTMDEWSIERKDLIVKDLKKDLKKINKTILKLETEIESLNNV